MPNVVLLTGISRHLGGAFARLLSRDDAIERIIGVDVVPPPHPVGRAEFVRADIRSPMISKVISGASVDTVVHMSVIATPLHVGGRSTQKEINVIGSMQLLAACQRAASVTKLVVKSTAGVYGSSPRDPAMFREDMAAKKLPAIGFGKDSAEVEGYVRGLARRRPDVEITMLRFANVIGPRVRTAMTDYFTLPLLPMPLGYSARLQFVHEDDVASAMVRATHSPGAGTVNVAGDGVITMPQAVALTGRPFLAVPPGTSAAMSVAFRRAGLIDFSPDQLELLVYGRGIDTTAMRTRFGFAPAYTTREAFADFVAAAGPRPIDLARRRAAALGADIDRMVRSAAARIPGAGGLALAGTL
ncbi:MAG: NAD-dependent epimerase/dehydratase family protein [Dermatophilaceae bacterium]